MTDSHMRVSELPRPSWQVLVVPRGYVGFAGLVAFTQDRIHLVQARG
jgi:hypothetical protein